MLCSVKLYLKLFCKQELTLSFCCEELDVWPLLQGCLVFCAKIFVLGLCCKFFKKNLEDISPFRGATDTPVLDVWWRLPWILKARVDTSLARFSCVVVANFIAEDYCRRCPCRSGCNAILAFMVMQRKCPNEYFWFFEKIKYFYEADWSLFVIKLMLLICAFEFQMKWRLCFIFWTDLMGVINTGVTINSNFTKKRSAQTIMTTSTITDCHFIW